MTELELLEKAREARKMSYSPYSKFKVGAALLAASGRVYLGCNIENAAFTPTNCAERLAFFRAVSEGERKFAMIAVAGAQAGSDERNAGECYPCGVCRQVMSEFCDGDFKIILSRKDGGISVLRLDELLPFSFGLDTGAK